MTQEEINVSLFDEVKKLKALLRKYAVTNHTGNNVSCNCCLYFGLYTHKEGCELAPYVTKILEGPQASGGADGG
jgi:hypothetical protein